MTSQTQTGTPTRRDRKRYWLGAAIFLVFALAFLRYIGVFGGNVHAVVPGKVYRSAQLTGRNLDEVLVHDHIRSELNLRGGDMSKGFYRDEIAECRLHGVTHYDIPMSARRYPSPTELRELFDVFDHAPYPILFHCKAGSDRTGLVSTIYLNAYQNLPIQEAYTEGLTWQHGHFSFGETHAMDDFVHLYERTSNGESLRQWSVDRYPTLYAQLPAGDKNADPRNG